MYMLILKKPLVSSTNFEKFDQSEFVDQSEQCSVRDLAARTAICQQLLSTTWTTTYRAATSNNLLAHHRIAHGSSRSDCRGERSCSKVQSQRGRGGGVLFAHRNNVDFFAAK